MKYAPLVAGGALGLLVLSLCTAKAIDPPDRIEALDIAGVDTVEVRSSDNIRISIRSQLPASMKYHDSTDSKVHARKIGSRLVIDAEIDGYDPLEVGLPASVHRFILHKAEVRTKETLPDVELIASDDVTWAGNAGRLVFRDTAKHEHRRGCDCTGTTVLDVEEGDIRELYVYSPDGALHLGDPDDVGAVYAWLGASGAVTLTSARRFDQIHLAKTQDEMPAVGARAADGP